MSTKRTPLIDSAFVLSLCFLLLVPIGLSAQESSAQASAAQESSAQESAAQTEPSPPTFGPMDLFFMFSRTQLGNAGFERREFEHKQDTGLEHKLTWWEKGDGPPLVLIHGVNDQAGTWFQIAPKLAETYRVLAPDLPGHGDSPSDDGPLLMSDVYGGFEAWLRATVDEPAILVGNSMGAWIAALAAREAPEKVARLVLTNGGPLRADTGDLDLFPKDREEARRLMQMLRDPSNPPTLDVVLDDLVRRAPTSQASRMFQAEEDLEAHLWTDDLVKTLATPVDLLWGESDRYLGAEYPRRLQGALPAARLKLVPKCGHVPQVECPDRYRELLSDVLASDPPSPDEPSTAKKGMP